MTTTAIIATHLDKERRLLESLTREKNKRGREVPWIQAARFYLRIETALRLADVRIEAQEKATRAMLLVIDARAAALARGEQMAAITISRGE